ncbi:L-threonylcarbamoyladenylate synthase [Caviibacter abscessus]|uniref:L-threonylcarbamoyladenylate synthase n=1 Tax=Caviibacter abscessus TaxID=1766719 RepID=UPI0008366131|nr:L-threonylcarbamoyladenylate synthase [Caviibacter abscessus]
MKLSNSTTNFEKAYQILKDGHPIIFPTDTVYGLGALPNEKSIKKIYELKQRDAEKKIIALVSGIDMIHQIADDVDDVVVKKFMPGPLTIVFKAKNSMRDIVGDTIGVRIPNNELALELLKYVGGILMTTSANISGEPPATKLENISKNLLSNIKYTIVADSPLSGVPSTIVSYIDKKYTLLRKGEIPFNEIINLGGPILER